MVNIGELLGRGEIANLFSETVEEGEVYRLRLSINSEVNPHLPACRKELHYLLKATDYDFLEGEDCFVDCSDFKKISKERFADLFSAEKQKGKINQQDVKKIKDLICSYENVSMKIPLFVLNGYSARDSGYRAATNINYLWNTKNLHS